ncbi:MAG: hypothetical protein ACE5JM_09515, partial [Armatimonadota bacterium]
MSRRVTLAVILAVAVGLPVLGQPPPPEEFIQGLSSETTTDLADALAREGYRLLGEYEYEAAQQYSDYAVRANRVSFLGHWVVWRAQELMAEEWSEDGDLEETIAGMLKQREDNPDDVVAIFNGAIADEHAGKVAPAADAYQKLLVDFPEQAVLHLRLGTVLSRLERYEESVDELEQALQLDAHLKEAFEPLAMGCLQLEHFDAAADAADKALEVAPDSVQLHHARAIIAAAQGQRTEAFGHVLEGNRIERSLPGLGHWLMSVWGVGATWGPV